MSHIDTILHVFDDPVLDAELRNEFEKTTCSFISGQGFEKVYSLLNLQITLIVISTEVMTKAMTDFFKHIKSSVLKDIPIVAIVSTKENIYTKNVMKMGYNDYISKENDPKTIARQITEFLDKEDKHADRLNQINVAVIDDDAVHNQLVKRALENKGIHQIQIFQSGEDFFNSPVLCDVYLVDIVMKKISGIKVVQKIKEINPTALVIVISSVAEDKLVTTALLNGADDFIQKPVNFEIFMAKMLARIR